MKVSVIIPTYNGNEFIEDVLIAIFNQKTEFSFEVIVIDSGSRDNTVEIVKKFPVQLIEIANSEYNHGDTRNLGARSAKGEYLVFITQDATPANNHWLQEMIAGFYFDSNIANVLGKQIPRADANPVVKRNIEETFKMIGNGNDEVTVYYIKDGTDGEIEYNQKRNVMRFNSNVNSAYRKEAWEKVPFRRIEYAEDQLMGQDLLEAGYKRVYNPKAAVFHSHNYPIKDFLKRFFDEYKGLNVAFGFVDENVTLLRIIPGTLYGWYNDSLYIFNQPEYPFNKKIRWLMYGFFMNLFRRLGAYLGGRHKSLPVWMKNFLSLEHNNKK